MVASVDLLLILNESVDSDANTLSQKNHVRGERKVANERFVLVELKVRTPTPDSTLVDTKRGRVFQISLLAR